MEDERDHLAEYSDRGDRQDAVWHAGGVLQVIPLSSNAEESDWEFSSGSHL